MELEELGEPEWGRRNPEDQPCMTEETEPDWVDAYEF